MMPFQVIFEALNDNSPEAKAHVKEKLIEKFKVPAEKAERMVNSTPIVVKKGLTQEQAAKYKTALESIGAQASVRLMVEEAETKSAENPVANTSTDSAPLTKDTVLPPTKPEATEHLEKQTNVLEKPTPSSATPTQRVDQGTQKVDVNEPEFIFYNSLEEEAKTEVSPAITAVKDNKQGQTSESAAISTTEIDPYKTVVAAAQPVSVDESEMQTVVQQAVSSEDLASPDWWQSVHIINPPFDEQARSVTPMTSGRVTARGAGFTIAHPTIDEISYPSILLISAFQTGLNTSARRYLDIFSTVSPRPIRLDTDLININSFGIPHTDDGLEKLSSFIKLLIKRNKHIIIDLPTFKFLKDKTLLKIVCIDREVERYCGKLQSEIDNGIDPKVNSHIITCQQANELFDTPDPWVTPPPVPPPSYPMPGPMMPGPMPPGMMPPDPYSTTPMRPPNTGATPPNFTQAQPTVVNPPYPQPPQYPQYPPPPGAPFPPGGPGTGQVPPPGYANPAQYNQQQPPPGQQPYPKTAYAPPPQGHQPYGMPPPLPGQQNQGMYPHPGFNAPMGGPMPGGMPMPPGMAPGYADPNIEFEIKKAREGAQTALVFSIIGLLCNCLFPLSIIGLIKSQDVLQVMERYNVLHDRNKAVAAKYLSIAGLVWNALIFLKFILAR